MDIQNLQIVHRRLAELEQRTKGKFQQLDLANMESGKLFGLLYNRVKSLEELTNRLAVELNDTKLRLAKLEDQKSDPDSVDTIDLDRGR